MQLHSTAQAADFGGWRFAAQLEKEWQESCSPLTANVTSDGNVLLAYHYENFIDRLKASLFMSICWETLGLPSRCIVRKVCPLATVHG